MLVWNQIVCTFLSSPPVASSFLQPQSLLQPQGNNKCVDNLQQSIHSLIPDRERLQSSLNLWFPLPLSSDRRTTSTALRPPLRPIRPQRHSSSISTRDVSSPALAPMISCYPHSYHSLIIPQRHTHTQESALNSITSISDNHKTRQHSKLTKSLT